MTDDLHTESGWSETTEPEHRHYCDLCGGIWSHQDEMCEAPRWSGYYSSGGYDCPMCQDEEDAR